MKFFITGGTGFVGTTLVRRLVDQGYKVTAIVRSEAKRKILPSEVSAVFGNTMEEGIWQEQLKHHDVIINLAGQNIFMRWTTENKRLMWESRILTTRNIVNGLHSIDADNRPTLINAGAVGYFGFCRDEEKLEDANPGTDFLARLCVDWEEEARKAREKGGRVVITRFGIVLGPKGGALGKMIPAFRMGLGGRLGNGRQWFPWIHIDDLVSALLFVIKHDDISGPVNFCTPYPVRNSELTAALSKTLKRPAMLPVPGLVLNLALGELAGVLLKGCKVMPGVLTKKGFKFIYSDIESALQNVIGEPN